VLCAQEKRQQGGIGSRREDGDGLDDDEEEFRLPRSHRPMENLDTEGLEQASVDTKLSSSNVGFKLMQKMGWKGKGLGKNEQGLISTSSSRPGHAHTPRASACLVWLICRFLVLSIGIIVTELL
jgi:hypothetical protein